LKYSDRIKNQKIGLVRKFTDEANKLPYNDKIFLSIGVPDMESIDYLHDGVNEAFEKGYTRYTPTAGMDIVRETIAGQYKNRKTAYPISKDNILLTAGSQEAIFLLALATLDKGDEVIIISPAFFSFKRCSTIMGAKCIEISYKVEDGKYFLPLEDIKANINENTRYIYVNSPNNPSGALSSREELRELSKIADKNGIYIVSDEVYKDYVYNGKFHSTIEFSDKTIVVDSISKSFSATGFRIGWLLADKDIIEKLLPAHQQILFSISSLNQYAVHYAMNKEDIQEKVSQRIDIFKERHDLVYKRLNKMQGIECPVSEGAFYLLPRLKPEISINGTDFCYKLMYEKRVILIPGIDFGASFENHIRIAYTQDIKLLSEAMDRMELFVNDLIG